MCGRYVYDDTENLEARFNVSSKADLKPNYNVAPGQMMPIIKVSHDQKDELKIMKWGLIPSWSKDASVGYKLINARSETIFEKPSWKRAIKVRRCIIPASGFYEWKRDGSARRQPYYITVKDEELFGFAGIWEGWKNEEGKEIYSYSIITTSPNKEMSELHDRMPVILHREDEDSWLRVDDVDYLRQVMRPYEDDGLLLVPVSKNVNLVKNNDGQLIKPMNSK